MNCQDNKDLVHALIDDEFDLVTAMQLDGHLKTCERCRRVYESAKAVKTAVANPALRFEAPAEMRDRILALTRPEKSAVAGRTSGIRRFWLPLGLAAAFVLVCGLYLTLRNGAGSPQFALEREILDTHIRALQEPQESHLYDVKSIDQHTVKPWFDQHLDFSPPVKQLAPDGFPLLGGRLDYVDGHSVASLVYGRDKHRINLFVWPNESGDGRFVDRGFNLFHWSEHGMTFWAVSDLDPRQLERFEALIRATFLPASTSTN